MRKLYNIENPLIGLTGGIATGKSTVSKYLSSKGFHVIDADFLVKKIYQKKETIDFIRLKFPKCYEDQRVNFPKLRQRLFSNPEELSLVENFIYKYLEAEFISSLPEKKDDLVIYDIPLLFEKEMNDRFDLVLLVYADQKTQIERLRKRDQSDSSTIEAILKSQLPIESKREESHYIIENSSTTTLEELYRQIDQFIQKLPYLL